MHGKLGAQSIAIGGELTHVLLYKTISGEHKEARYIEGHGKLGPG